MARDTLADAVDSLVLATGGRFDELDDLLHLVVTDALEDANSAEEAGDLLGTVLSTSAVLSSEALRTLATAVQATLAAAGPGAAIRLDLSHPVDVTAEIDPAVLVETVVRSLAAPPA